LPNNHNLVAIKDPRSANNVIGTSINIITHARGGVGDLSLKAPQNSGNYLLNCHFKIEKFFEDISFSPVKI